MNNGKRSFFEYTCMHSSCKHACKEAKKILGGVEDHKISGFPAAEPKKEKLEKYWHSDLCNIRGSQMWVIQYLTTMPLSQCPI